MRKVSTETGDPPGPIQAVLVKSMQKKTRGTSSVRGSNAIGLTILVLHLPCLQSIAQTFSMGIVRLRIFRLLYWQGEQWNGAQGSCTDCKGRPGSHRMRCLRMAIGCLVSCNVVLCPTHVVGCCVLWKSTGVVSLHNSMGITFFHNPMGATFQRKVNGH